MCPHAERPTGATFSEVRGYYSRLFPPTLNRFSRRDEERLIRLGQSMRYTTEREGTLTPRVGFTYFGQFVGHDLSHDPSPLEGSHTDAGRIPNYRSPYLNLEQIYGGGPKNSLNLYEGEASAETFKIGTTAEGTYQRDLPIENGELLVADNRNLDNLILRQLHVVFLKFHNEAIRQLSARPSTIAGVGNLGEGTIFEQAQRLVRWHYQWIVRHDFLPRILHHSLWVNGRSGIISETSCIPIEFSLAAYRFGHSMVRKAYGLNCLQKRVELAELMRLGHQQSQLGDDLVIEWGRFFDGLPKSGPVASSSYLDTAIAFPLHGMSESVIRLCIKQEASDTPINLPVRTLLRGARAQLPSGQEITDSLIERGLLKKEYQLSTHQLTLDSCNRSGSVLRDVNLQGNTPLFYYLLKEAELIGLGRTLGPAGSYIVAEVILGALQSDPEGYISVVGPNWELPTWCFPSGARRKINSLLGIIRLIGADQLLPECDAKWHKLQPSHQV